MTQAQTRHNDELQAVIIKFIVILVAFIVASYINAQEGII